MLPAIKNRRSVFPQFFTDQPVEEASIEALLEAANMAPSHKKTEPWRFRVYTGAGRDQLSQTVKEVYEAARAPEVRDPKVAPKFAKKIDQSPVVIAVFLHRDPTGSLPEWEEVAAVACAVENLWVSLDHYDLGGYWSSPGFLCGRYGQWPDAEDNERCLGLFYLGHYEMPDLPRPRGAWEDKVIWTK
ncbi:nitroreductase family protein [Neolewinella persica]|uniref:nitroreductase family protein n=1 Tax=Neolewinella persica TaxID=70998 RepID=UPI000371E5FE|nr:nitroreductase [Neolewinella persica]